VTVSGTPDVAGSSAPRWLWATVLLLAAGVVWHAAVGMVLAFTIGYHLVPTTLLGGLATLASWPALRAAVPRHLARPDDASATTAAVVTVLIAIATLAWNVVDLGEHVITERDPGAYVTTGRWLADGGDLRPEVTLALFEGVPGITYESPAVFDLAGSAVTGADPASVVPSGRLEFQFSRGPSIVMATAADLAGSRAALTVSAVIGAIALGALHLLLSTLTRRQVLVGAGVAALAVSLPFLHVTRATYSEPFVLLVLLVGMAVLLGRDREAGPVPLAVAGAFVAAGCLFRVDAQLYVIALGAVACVLAVSGAPARHLAALLLPAVPFLVLGIVDIRVFSRAYARDLEDDLRRLDLVTVAVVLTAVALAVAVRRPRWRDRPLTTWPRAAPALGVAVTIVFGLLWWVRPELHRASAPWATDSGFAGAVTGLQAQLGLEIDPTRSYAELSLRSLGWYLGIPLLALAGIGLGLLTTRAVRDLRSPAAVLVALTAVGMPLYLWAPNITPDHLWATRRFVPFIVPVLVVAAVVAADALVDVAATRLPARRRDIGRQLALAAAAVALVLPVLTATRPVRHFTDRAGWLPALGGLCEELGPDATVLEVGTARLAMPLRAFCGAEAAAMATTAAPATTVAAVRTVIESARRNCVAGLAIVSAAPDVLAPIVAEAVPIAPGAERRDLVRITTVNEHAAEQTLVDRPARYVVQPLQLDVFHVELPASCDPAATLGT
jgi:hypothetical protein